MSDSINEDDFKFNELFVKQHSTVESFIESLPEPEDSIESDDMKLDDLLLLQTISSEDEVQHKSVEEKYEEELLIDDIAKKFTASGDIRLDEDGDGDIIFWIEGEDDIEIIPIYFEEE